MALVWESFGVKAGHTKMLGNRSQISNFSNSSTSQPQNYNSRAASYLDLPAGCFDSVKGHGGFPNSIGEYGMGRLLGRGAFGSVYEVTEIRHKTPLNEFKYAIKIMEKKSIKNEEMAKRVRNEVSLHTKLRHPNILSLYHFFEDDERVYLVMELCSGGEIYSLLRRRRESNGDSSGVLTESETRIILRDVVAGLKFLHSRGIIHRDLKLSNILLSEGGQAKIADFGLAVLTEHSEASSNSNNNFNNSNNAADSRERTICGTPNYLAPEILNKKNYGRGADIWSLGCLLYSFLTGRPPFDSPDLPQTFAKVKRLDYQIPDHLSPAARDLITRLLAGDPANRPTFDQIIWHPFFNPAVTDPLSTRRLSPLKQMTKYGSIEILSDGGRVSIDFLDSPDVLIISEDGLRVLLINKRTGVQNHMATPITNLPSPLKRRYEYARRFINLVKGKSPLVILSTSTFKAYLMENSVGSSTGDFYVNYRDGLKRMEYCWVSRQLRIFDGPITCITPALTLNDPSPQALPDIPSPLHRELLLEFLARYRQCLQIRDGIFHPDGTERSKYRGMKFPIIIKEGGDNNDSVVSSRMMPVPSTTVSHNQTQNSNQFPNVRKYLPGVGWCLSVVSSSTSSTSSTSTTSNSINANDDQNYFLVLFNDGRSIQIDGHAETVLDLQNNRLLPINAQLPEDFKEMLALFSKFL